MPDVIPHPEILFKKFGFRLSPEWTAPLGLDNRS
jgi:hypothetical protein